MATPSPLSEVVRDLPDQIETREVDATLVKQLEEQGADYGVIEIARRYQS